MLTNQFMNRIHTLQLPRKIMFGTGISEKIGLEAKDLDAKNVLLITDENLKKIGLLRKIEDSLNKEDLNVEIFSRVEAEPRLEVAEIVAEVARKKKYDMIIGCGGGSVLDMSKVAAMAATNPGAVGNYVGVNLVKKSSLHKILLPTTSGTSSEVTNVAVVTLVEDEIKTGIVSPYMIGDVAIVDPSLTYGLPPRVTAATGLDALSHALETLMSLDANPITDALALKATELISSNLLQAYAVGDSKSRYNMSLGSLTAGMAFGNAGVCMGHAIAYAFAATYHVPHGVSCGLVLPYTLRFNGLAIGEKLKKIAEAMGIDAKDMKPDELVVSVPEAIFHLADELKMPQRLRDVGVPKEAVTKIAEKSVGMSRLMKRNPRPISREEALRVVEEMW